MVENNSQQANVATFCPFFAPAKKISPVWREWTSKSGGFGVYSSLTRGTWGFKTMTTDIVVDLSLKTAEEVALLATVADAFVQQFLCRNRAGKDAPDMMVRTAFGTDGEVSKTVIFQDRKWADAFVDFWENQKSQSQAA